MAQATALKRPPAPAPSVAPSGDFLGTAVDRERRRGRGTLSNASGRYEPIARIAFDDGWQSLEELPPFETTVQARCARKIITRNDLPDISFDRSINPYRGCEHGCVYCFARPTHAISGCRRGLISNPSCSSSRMRRSCWSASFGAALLAADHRDRHQHRSLSADRGNTRSCAASCRCWSARAIRSASSPSRPGRARHRHSRPHGRAQSRQGRDLGDDASIRSSRATMEPRAATPREAARRRCDDCRTPASRRR